MREIEFRGQRKDTGEWVYGFYMLHPFKGNPVLCSVIVQNQIPYEVIPETVGQFTGKRDKNGKKIYKKDKIEAIIIENSVATMGTIVWDNEHSYYANKNKAGLTPLYKLRSIEVIGTIHSNPELLDQS